MTDITHDDVPRTSLRLPLLAGAAVALIIFAGFGGWAALAPLASAAAAPAIVVPDGSRKTVQHLEGGIVRRVLVHDGSQVEAGEALVELDDTRTRAEHAALLFEWRAFKANEARLLADRSGAETIAFPQAIAEAATVEAAVAVLLAGEHDRLASQRAAFDDQNAILAERISQAESEIHGRMAEIDGGKRQLAFITEEIGAIRDLFAKGLERKSRLLALERARAGIEAEIGAGQAAVARSRQAIAETRRQIQTLQSERAERIADELAQVRRDLAGCEERLRAVADQLARTVVRAPVSGAVVDLKVTTPGGVISPGEPLLSLVPANAELLLEARVAPTDIDEVHAGLRARVHLLAYKSRALPSAEGTVRDVSADRLEDAHTRLPYYLVRVAVERSSLPPEVRLTPGMPADVLIVTGARTLLGYLMQPFVDVLRGGLNEG
ncbi:MAG TPA: HlyD family type I secretion periplasmic adaptor subunit [Azospirillum sp.]|nr:HlyD family type I secretion periplasmic adaptor subunit [Azospirillum sp.]